ncbi:outer membrane homotrimeric porin [Desulfonatronum thiodismutans]|uniref:outer membrane homotrimeric porin n=1 Tax=Desulfonatronum thiodismutans TaxID=159290 RepID=UPI0004ABEB4C|nr:outer membrane homotrimeric porin [Desulfonatronum thiodismutans]
MKKLVVLAVLAAFILGTAGFASAIELNAKGNWRVHFNYLKNTNDFDGDSKYDKFQAMQRARVLFEFIASENLKGVLHFEIGNQSWGNQGHGAALNADGVNVKTKNAFIQFAIPGTQAAVKAGIQGFALPSTYGSHILSADVAALAAIIPFNDMMGLTVAWARPYDLTQGTANAKIEDEVDVFAAVLPISLDGVKLNPFAVYARWGKDFLNGAFGANADPNPFKNANQWFAGLNFAVDMLDPFVIKGDFNYGSVKLTDNFKASGFIADVALAYKMDMMTPEVYFLYETGEDSKYSRGGDSKRMPTIGTDGTSWAPTSFGMVGSSFGGGTDGIMRGFIADLPGASDLDSYWATEGTIGMWATGVKLGDITFVQDLSHTLGFMFAKGTNDTANANLFTKDDKYYEVTFDHKYQIYENLSLLVETAWGKMDLDKLNVGKSREDLAKDSAWKLAAGFNYRF